VHRCRVTQSYAPRRRQHCPFIYTTDPTAIAVTAFLFLLYHDTDSHHTTPRDTSHVYSVIHRHILRENIRTDNARNVGRRVLVENTSSGMEVAEGIMSFDFHPFAVFSSPSMSRSMPADCPAAFFALRRRQDATTAEQNKGSRVAQQQA